MQLDKGAAVPAGDTRILGFGGKAIDHLLQRVDLDYNLPDDVDLICEAETVIQYLHSSDSAA